MAGPSRKGKRRKHYSKGELNRLIDDLVHPLLDKRPELMMLDVVLPGFVEQNANETAAKFVRHSLPKLIRILTERS